MQIPIVDKDDNFLKYIDRKDLNSNQICRVSGLFIYNDKQEIFIAQRSLKKQFFPGYWGPAVTGTIEKGETYESNIIKETKEEIGIDLKEYIIGPKLYYGPENGRILQLFFAKINKDISEFKKQEDEVEQFCWIDFESLEKDLNLNPNKYSRFMKRFFDEYKKYFNI